MAPAAKTPYHGATDPQTVKGGAMAQVFDGTTVLDFTSGRAGGVATMALSDFGAEVIKVEPPGGEKFRDSPGSIQF